MMLTSGGHAVLTTFLLRLGSAKVGHRALPISSQVRHSPMK